MEDRYAWEMLRTGIAESRSGNKEAARRYFERALSMTGASDILSDIWFELSEALDDPAEKRKALENCLSNDMHYAQARRALAILDGKLKADDVVNPDNLPAATTGSRSAQADRFMCPTCGGRMSFAPDGQSLVCDYCSNKNSVGNKTANEEQDFIIAMATLKGHGKPLQEQAFHCKGCGAEFFLPPGAISGDCAYCDSPHVVRLEETKDLLAPDAIIPHAFDQQQATRLLIEWVEKNRIKPERKVELPRGSYMPLWTFDVGGTIEYTAELMQQEEEENESFLLNSRQTRLARVTEQYPVIENDVPVPASRKLPAIYPKLIATFDLTALKPYDPRYLASWPAEIYDVPMADASLDARGFANKSTKKKLPQSMFGYRILSTSSAGIMVESFKLNLLPVWKTEIPHAGGEFTLLINGQTGSALSNMPDLVEEKGGLLGFLGDLLGE